MNVMARRAFECSDVKTGWAGRDTCQHGSCLACGATWSGDNHDARLGSGGSATRSQSPGGCHYKAGDGATMPRRNAKAPVNFAQLQTELDVWFTN
jgi:hypothetical protein